MDNLIFIKILTSIAKVGVVVIFLVIWWRFGTLTKNIVNKRVLKELREYAKKVKKPILNLGCGRTNYGDINADIISHGVENFMIIDANHKLPFKNKQFSSVVASNIIEHLDNPEFSLKEMKRIANKVYIAYPKWWQVGTWLTPDHRWLVSKRGSELKFIRYNPTFAYLTIVLLLLLWIV